MEEHSLTHQLRELHKLVTELKTIQLTLDVMLQLVADGNGLPLQQAITPLVIDSCLDQITDLFTTQESSYLRGPLQEITSISHSLQNLQIR